jgi:RimJ/RimL family protein N-acetyltransferase
MPMGSLVEAALPPGSMSTRSQPTLCVPGEITIRPWAPSDWPEVIYAFRDPEIQRWHMLTIESEDEARDWINTRNSSWVKEVGANWIVLNHQDQATGRIGLRDINLFIGQAECTYWTLPKFRGLGWSGTALRLLTRWCFSELGMNRLQLTHSVKNLPSCRVADKAGFLLEGTLRSQVPHPDGRHDMHIHSRLPDDGEGRAGAGPQTRDDVP